MTTAEAAFDVLAERFRGEPGIEVGTGFGSAPGLRIAGKIFAMLPRDELVVKLPAPRCAELIDAGRGRAFRVGQRTMREWLVVDGVDERAWADLATDALAHVRG